MVSVQMVGHIYIYIYIYIYIFLWGAEESLHKKLLPRQASELAAGKLEGHSKSTNELPRVEFL